MGMTFDLNIGQASAAAQAEEGSNVILTVLIAAMRRGQSDPIGTELLQYEEIAHTRLNPDVVEWLNARNIQYKVGVMRITIDDPDHAMEFKLRWL